MVNIPPIPPGDIVRHFKTLLQSHTRKQRMSLSLKKGPLDNSISQEEIMTALKSLKNSSSCGIDSITNDIMKIFVENYAEFTANLFNSILESNNIPVEWSTSILLPLHKKGSKSSIVRGISLISVFCKLFCLILNKRLVACATTNKIFSPVNLDF